MIRFCRHIPEFGRALRHGTTFPTRLTLALATTMTAWAMAFDPRFESSPQYSVFLSVLPARLWALGFVTLAAGQWWRIFDTRSRQGFGLLINCLTFGTWLVYTVCGCLGPGIVPVDFAAEISITAASGWVALRTELNQRDRETA